LYPAKSVSVLILQLRVAVLAVAALTVKDTGIGCGLFVDPEAVTVIMALYVPAANPVRLTFAVTVPALTPDVGLRVNHDALSDALHVNVPLPLLEMLTVLAMGFVPPAVPVNERLVGLKPIAAPAVVAVIVRVTGRVLAEAPEAVTVIAVL
jgi:hypothetical protein